MPPSRLVRGDECPADRVADEGRLLVALDLEREARHDLVPAIALVVDVGDLRARADPAPCRDRRREAHLVPAVVDAEDEAGLRDQTRAESVDEAERQVAVRDRGAEWTLLL